MSGKFLGQASENVLRHLFPEHQDLQKRFNRLADQRTTPISATAEALRDFIVRHADKSVTVQCAFATEAVIPNVTEPATVLIAGDKDWIPIHLDGNGLASVRMPAITTVYTAVEPFFAFPVLKELNQVASKGFKGAEAEPVVVIQYTARAPKRGRAEFVGDEELARMLDAQLNSGGGGGAAANSYDDPILERNPFVLSAPLRSTNPYETELLNLNVDNQDPTFELFQLPSDHRVFVRYKRDRDTELAGNLCGLATLMNMFMASLDRDQTVAIANDLKLHGVAKVMQSATGNADCGRIVTRAIITGDGLADKDMAFLIQHLPTPGREFAWRGTENNVNLNNMALDLADSQYGDRLDIRLSKVMSVYEVPAIALLATAGVDPEPIREGEISINSHYVAAIESNGQVHIIDNVRNTSSGEPLPTQFGKWRGGQLLTGVTNYTAAFVDMCA